MSPRLLSVMFLASVAAFAADEGRKESVHVQASPSGNEALEWRMIGNRLVMTRPEENSEVPKPAVLEPATPAREKARPPEVAWYLKDGNLQKEVKEITEKGSGPQMPLLDAPAPAPKTVRRLSFRNKSYQNEPVVPDRFEYKPVSEDRPQPPDFNP